MQIIARKLSIIYLVTLALLFNAVAPVFANTYNDDLSTDGINNKVLVCTSQGYQWVTLDDQTDLNDTTKTSSIHCVSCINGDDVADNAQFNNLDLNHVLFSKKLPYLSNQYPLIQSRFLSRLEDNRAPPLL